MRLEIEDLVNGVCNQERFLQIQQDFVAFDQGADGYAKRIARPHQYFAVTKAFGSTVLAVESNGKAGVVWHTQGSGKSMEMELYAHAVARQPKLKDPTLVVSHRPHRARQSALRGVQPVATEDDLDAAADEAVTGLDQVQRGRIGAEYTVSDQANKPVGFGIARACFHPRRPARAAKSSSASSTSRDCHIRLRAKPVNSSRMSASASGVMARSAF